MTAAGGRIETRDGRGDASCARVSLDVGEALFGSAIGGVERWLLVEHDGAWAREALDSAELPAPLVEAVRRWQKAGPGRRVQLIRRGGGSTDVYPGGARRFFLVDGREGREGTLAASLADAEWSRALLTFETEDLAGPGEAPLPWRATARPLVLVCTHGRRDVCCARLGVPIAQALSEELSEDAPDVVWQTSHVGGHRFAANIVLLPHGYHFGRLEAPAARRIVRGYLRGRLIDLDRLRGRSSYGPEVQAAEYWFRQASGQYGVDAIRIARVDPQGGGVAVTLRDLTSGEVHEVCVSREVTSELAPPSCGASPEPVVRLRLDGLRRLAGAEA
jgi:hypothetical protein